MENKSALSTMFIYWKNSYFIIMKDRRSNFLKLSRNRLLNPEKTELGRINKVALDKIKLNLRNASEVSQSNITNDVTSFFRKMKNFC